MVDLNTLIPSSLGATLFDASLINDHGQIVARGITNTPGPVNTYLLTPINFAAVQAPVNSNGTSIFKGHGVVPIKFTLTVNSTGFNATATCQLPPASIAVTRVASTDTGAVTQDTYGIPSDNGANFRISACQYIYNVDTSSLGTGRYLDVAINGTIVGSAAFGIN